MADNDLDLSIGVKVDSKDLDAALGKSVDKFTKEFRAQFSSILNDIAGGEKFFTSAATKDWTKLPYVKSHMSGGQAYTTGLMMSGMLKEIPYRSDSANFNNALMVTGLSGAIKDPRQLSGMFNALGMKKAYGMSLPGSSLMNTIETNQKLLAQSWASAFVSEKITKTPLRTPTKKVKRKRNADGKLVPLYTETTETDVDFAGMRDYAVETGLGRWKDKKAGNTAENFELIDDEIDKINEKSSKPEKTFEGWNNTLKGVLGTLTAIAGVALGAGIKIAANAEQAVSETAKDLKNTRYFLGMSTSDVQQTYQADTLLGIGKGSIYKDIESLSNKRALFKNLGEDFGVLPSSLLNIFDNVTEDTPAYQLYKDIAQELLDLTKRGEMDNGTMLALMSKLGLGSLSEIVGALADPTNLGAEYATVQSLFDFIRPNSYRGVWDEVERTNAQLKPIEDSIDTTMLYLQNEWTKDVTTPIKSWWDTFLQEHAPQIEKIIEGLGKVVDKVFGQTTTQEQEAALGSVVTTMALATQLGKKSARNIISKAENSYTSPAAINLKSLPGLSSYFVSNSTDEELAKRAISTEGVTAFTLMGEGGILDRLAKTSPESVAGKRAAQAIEFLETTQLRQFADNNVGDPIDEPLLRATRDFLLTGNIDSTLAAFVGALYDKMDVEEAKQSTKDFFDIKPNINIQLNLTQDESGNWHYTAASEAEVEVMNNPIIRALN